MKPCDLGIGAHRSTERGCADLLFKFRGPFVVMGGRTADPENRFPLQVMKLSAWSYCGLLAEAQLLAPPKSAWETRTPYLGSLRVCEWEGR